MEARRRTFNTHTDPSYHIYLPGLLSLLLNRVRGNIVGCFNETADHLMHHPGGNAVISLIFSEYLNRLFWNETFAGASVDDLPQWSIKLTAVAAVVFVSIICVATPNLGTRTAVVFTTVKVRYGIIYDQLRLTLLEP